MGDRAEPENCPLMATGLSLLLRILLGRGEGVKGGGWRKKIRGNLLIFRSVLLLNVSWELSLGGVSATFIWGEGEAGGKKTGRWE